MVKQWNPNVKLVGFKLLVDSKSDDLLKAAQDSIKNNGCDLVVANDLRALKAGNHKILLVSKDGWKIHSSNLPKIVAEQSLEL